MPTYDYFCHACNVEQEIKCKIQYSEQQTCKYCFGPVRKLPGAPLIKVAGRVTPGGGPDRFTADALGIPLKELPPGLKTKL